MPTVLPDTTPRDSDPAVAGIVLRVAGAAEADDTAADTLHDIKLRIRPPARQRSEDAESSRKTAAEGKEEAKKMEG